MNNDIDYNNPNPAPKNKGKVVAGIILLFVGIALLVNQFDFFFIPDWLFSWPMWVIAWGLYMGAKHNWQNQTWIIVVIVGSAFLLEDIIPGLHRHDIGWPIMVIAFGIYMIIKRNRKWNKNDWKQFGAGKWDWNQKHTVNPNEPVVDYTTSAGVPPADPNPSTGSYCASADDYLDALSIFGGVKKTIVSKDFKGGEIVNVFGGAEIDFTQANINGHVVIDITQVFGGTKILVPSHWRVVPDMAAVFASVDDKRIRTSAPADTDKLLVLKGISIFAGVDIRSY